MEESDVCVCTVDCECDAMRRDVCVVVHRVTGVNGSMVPMLVESLSSVRLSQMSAGGKHTCGVVEGSGEVMCWGLGTSGQLGRG